MSLCHEATGRKHHGGHGERMNGPYGDIAVRFVNLRRSRAALAGKARPDATGLTIVLNARQLWRCIAMALTTHVRMTKAPSISRPRAWSLPEGA